MNVFTTRDTLLTQVIDAHTQLSEHNPLIHYITNNVAANYVANILLAIGSSPAHIDNPHEAAAFTEISAALSLNLGTPTPDQVQAMLLAAETAHQNNISWVLDPVGYGAILSWRTEITHQLLAFKPTILRGNASEIAALAGAQYQAKGVDSTIASQDIYHQAKTLLTHSQCVAISGASDFILSQEYQCVFQVDGGSALQPRITATGCALGAVIAAYAAVSTPTIACLAAHIHFAIAGQIAEKNSTGLGSFAVAFMDAISTLRPDDFQHYANFKQLEL